MEILCDNLSGHLALSPLGETGKGCPVNVVKCVCSKHSYREGAFFGRACAFGLVAKRETCFARADSFSLSPLAATTFFIALGQKPFRLSFALQFSRMRAIQTNFATKKAAPLGRLSSKTKTFAFPVYLAIRLYRRDLVLSREKWFCCKVSLHRSIFPPLPVG